VPAVESAAKALKDCDADGVVALGGGSAIVTARAASILLAEKGSVHELCTGRDANGKLVSPKLLAPKLPQFAIPTTPTTATVKAGSAVLDPVNKARLALFDPKTRAQAVFVHPKLLATPPRELVVSAGLNTLAMAVEGLMSHQGDPFSDALLVHAAAGLVQRLPEADGVDARAELMLASLMCGHATDFTGAGIAIPLGHAISAKSGLDNGLANAILLPHVLRFNAPAAQEGLEKLDRALSDSRAERNALTRVIGALERMSGALAIATRLRDVGIGREALTGLAEVAAGDWFVRTNPRPVQGAAELLQVLEEAW
jgi:alcohol dehydrogenase class IV